MNSQEILDRRDRKKQQTVLNRNNQKKLEKIEQLLKEINDPFYLELVQISLDLRKQKLSV